MIRRRLTFANVISVIALFVALGGVGYASGMLPRNSVGTPQLKKNAVTGAKIKNRSVTGADIRVSSLPTVPSAAVAEKAAAATRADTAARADSATKADSATRADTAARADSAAKADSAADAGALGGVPASSYQRACPAGEAIDSVGGAGTPHCLRVAALALAASSTAPSLDGAAKLKIGELSIHLSQEASILATATPDAGTTNGCPAFACTAHLGLYLDEEPMPGGDQERSAPEWGTSAEFTSIQGLRTAVAPGDHLLTAYLVNGGAGGLATPGGIGATLSAIVLSE